MVAFLKALEFEQVRQKGSHKFFRHADGRTATVPDHKGEDLGRGITKKILKDVEASEGDLLNWLKKR
jgi:predicted RNA binding protein YcfA (HicA-like mRNA interferase family)